MIEEFCYRAVCEAASCVACDARVGEPCRTITGRIASRPHETRIHVWIDKGRPSVARH